MRNRRPTLPAGAWYRVANSCAIRRHRRCQSVGGNAAIEVGPGIVVRVIPDGGIQKAIRRGYALALLAVDAAAGGGKQDS